MTDYSMNSWALTRLPFQGAKKSVTILLAIVGDSTPQKKTFAHGH
jgi:hypothetical protein